MQAHAYLIVALALVAPAALVVTGGACGSSVIVSGTPDAGSDEDGGFVFLDSGSDATGPDVAPPPHDALPDYVDPGCPNKPEPIKQFTCDPYDQGNGDCQPTEGCYIYVQYPSEPCGQETYGSYCAPAGMGGQGAPCGGGGECAPGFECVISGSGVQCVKLCSLKGEDGCPPGLVCEPIDVEGFGGCL